MPIIIEHHFACTCEQSGVGEVLADRDHALDAVNAELGKLRQLSEQEVRAREQDVKVRGR